MCYMAEGSFRIDVYHHLEGSVSADDKLDAILARLTEIGATMVDQSAALAELKVRLNEDWQHAQDLIAQLVTERDQAQADRLAAMADDAADQATIDATKADLDAANAASQAAVDEINAIDLDAAFPPVEPPANGGGEVPPADDGGSDSTPPQ